MPRYLLPLLLAGLAACGGEETPAPEAPVAPAAAVEPDTPDLRPARTPEAMLEDWSQGLKQGDWDAAQAYWRSDASGRAEELAAMQPLQALTVMDVTYEEARTEGAAGSLYFETNVLITGQDDEGSVHSLAGPVTLRRANDVPGATPEQLQWRIVSLELREQER